MQYKPKSRQSDLVVQDSLNELLVYDLKLNKVSCLNQTARMIFKLSNGQKTVREINDLLNREMKSDIPEELIWVMLDRLKKVDLIEQKEALEVDFKGLTRQEVVQKNALTTALALPVISSVIAPSSAQAQSGCVLNVCIAAGQNICAGCNGQSLNRLVYSSTNGICTGTGTPAASINCGGTGVTTSVGVKKT